MKFTGNSRWIVIRSGALAMAAGLALAAPASARVVVGFGFGVPLMVGPAPWYYAPPPVVYMQPPVMVAPQPPAYVSQPQQSWYYCDNPKGYYPYVATCGSGWREVPAQPAPPPQP